MSEQFDVASMFDSIKDSLKNEKKTNAFFKDIIKLEAVNTYIGRLIPNISNPRDTFFHYYEHGWESLSTGQYHSAICPQTWGDRCNMCEDRFKLYKKSKEAGENPKDRNAPYRKLAYQLRQYEKHLVNWYVIDDPTDKENNGLVKVLRFGVRVKEKIDDATTGDGKNEFGPKVFDLSENGCNLMLKVETNSEGKRSFTNYSNSRFMMPSAIEGMTPEKMKEVYESIFDLSTFIDPKTSEEMQEMMDTHLYCKDEDPTKTKPITVNSKNDDDDHLPGLEPIDAIKEAIKSAEETVPESEPEKAPGNKTESEVASQEKEKVNELLAELDNL